MKFTDWKMWGFGFGIDFETPAWWLDIGPFHIMMGDVQEDLR